MKLGVRSKLFFISVALVVLAVGAAAVVLVPDLRSELEARIEEELSHHAMSAAQMLVRDGEAHSLDDLADRIGAATGSRITIVDRAGVVHGDSELTLEQLSSTENHRGRPEIVSAFETGYGQSRRYSNTLATDMFYVAVSAEMGGRWVVRASRPLREVEAAVSTLRKRLGGALLLGLLLAILMSALASHWLSRAVRDLASRAREIARGGRGERGRLGTERSDELGHLAGSLNELADSVASTVSTLAVERAQFEAVLDGMGEGVIALDAERRITLMNAAARELLAVSDGRIGHGLSDVVRAPALIDVVANGLPDEGATVEIALPRRRLLAKVTPPLTDGECIVVLHDITTVHRLEAVRRDFVANVSHELRTPVSVIQANSETLLSGALQDADAARTLAEAIHRNSVRMGNLIADLLDLSRLEAGAYELDLGPTSVLGIVERAADSLETRAADKNMDIDIDVEAGLLALADAQSLEQVVINLLGNAIKYTPVGGRIRVHASATASAVRIEVHDNGPGIAPAERERVFERFYRVDPGRSRGMGGTGLGLSIVRHLVTAMDGRVGVADASPAGSVFWVELPPAAS